MANGTSVLVGNIIIISVINLGLVKRLLAVYFLFRLGELRWEHGLGGWVVVNPIWAPDKPDKMVLLKNSFTRRYSRKIQLRAALACSKSDSRTKLDSGQANTARSQKLKCPQIQNWLTLRRVKLIFLIFENLNF